jgi:hypothetical protein
MAALVKIMMIKPHVVFQRKFILSKTPLERFAPHNLRTRVEERHWSIREKLLRTAEYISM